MRAALAIAIAVLAGCSHDWDAHERLPTGGTGAGGGGGGGGGSSATSTGSAVATGAGGAAECGDGTIGAGEQCDDGNDTAGDGCDACVVECDRNGAIQDPTSHHCYWAVHKHETFATARSRCQDAGPGVDLAAPSTAPELALIAPLVEEDTWLGASDVDTPGTFVWLNGEPWSYPPGAPQWGAGEPNDSGDCIDVATGGLLEDGSCGASKDYLCERTPAGE